MHRRYYVFMAVVFSFLTHTPALTAGDVIDRVVARVNGHIILLSDWDTELCFEAFEDARPPDRFTPQERQTALDRLVDRELMREQLKMQDSVPADNASVQSRLAQIRAAHPGTQTDDAWQSVLKRYGLTEKDLTVRVAAELNLMQSIDTRLRPNVQIDGASVEAYYKEKFGNAPAGAQVPLPEVAAKIREVLTEQRLNDLMSSWLQTLRAEGEIQTFRSSVAAAGEAR